MKNIVIIFLSLVLFTNCKDSGKIVNKDTASINEADGNLHPGKKLMETYCYACHNPTTDHDDRIAPPMVAVKKHYISEGTTKEEFIAAVQDWVKKPSEDKSKMPGAIRNFGLMPFAPYPEATVEQIADYMFDYDIDQPEWFDAHFNKERGQGMGQGKGNGQGMGKGMGQGQGKGRGQGNGQGMRHGKTASSDSSLSYEVRGLQYALSTKGQLGKNLLGAINKKGTKEAVTFCNERAYTLTDSMARVNRANIKRVSDKPRNQNNKANAKELAHIETFKAMVTNQQELEPIVEEAGNSVNFYYPITTNAMCLQCHGTVNKELKSDIYKTIKGLYPNDQAIGYDVDQVRGIWSITFDK